MNEVWIIQTSKHFRHHHHGHLFFILFFFLFFGFFLVLNCFLVSISWELLIDGITEDGSTSHTMDCR